MSRIGVSVPFTQQSDRPLDRDRPFNLYEPVAGDHGAHGVFDDRAATRSVQVWASKHKWMITAAAAIAGAAASIIVTRRD